jgi:hypothetical protein
VGGFESYFPGNQESAELFSRALVYQNIPEYPPALLGG